MKVLAWPRKHKKIICLWLLLYVLSYIALSNYGAYEAERYHSPGFFYMPLTVEKYSYSLFVYTHYALLFFYYPVYAIDHYMLTGRRCVYSMPLRGLEKNIKFHIVYRTF